MKDDLDNLLHYGMPRRSGRYPWGSGENPYQSVEGFNSYVADLKSEGLSESKIAKSLGMNTAELRAYTSIAKAHARDDKVREALKLKDKGYSNVAIGNKMGINESSVRSLLDPIKAKRSNEVFNTANALAQAIEKSGVIDVGVGVERYMGISRFKLKTAIKILETEGYKVHYLYTKQLGTGEDTSLMVLAPPDLEWPDVNQLKKEGKIGTVTSYTNDGGTTYESIVPPRNIDSSRIQIAYKEDGGDKMDGVIQVRRGVAELSLGNALYAQVRIGVDGTHYLKGMAVYSDDLPEGVDILFNTNKSNTNSKLDVLKKQTYENPENPFGATFKQRRFVNGEGEEELSAINIVNEEGDWGVWSKNLSSQFLSKQRPTLAKQQLKLALDLKKEEFEEIMSLTNPTIKKKLLTTFADGADSDAKHLKAAAMPRQANHVILPVETLSDKEVYAPNYRNGENVVLIRHPHGGTFEIPELIVNNKNPEAKALMGQAKDAIGINSKVAQILSGADYDGDTVLVIPNNDGGIKTSSPLKKLESFDPTEAYPAVEGMKVMEDKAKSLHMGKISNLITDMTIKGATHSELARAVRHSMVVIDAPKHKLNYEQSAIDNAISQLKEKYQGGATKGAATIISQAKSQKRVPNRTEGEYRTDPKTGKTKKHYIDPDTGKKLYTPTGETYTRNGKEIIRTTKSTKMDEVDDAFELSSGTPMEDIYAGHANELKSLANQARKEVVHTPNLEMNSSAKQTYKEEVASLNAKLNISLKNAPVERQAQIIGNAVYKIKLADNPDLDNEQKKRLKFQELDAARQRVGAKKEQIDITPREWEAIQAGAISNNKLSSILDNADLTQIKEYATPRAEFGITPSKLARANSMLSRGYTQAEIADTLGVSVSGLNEALKGS